MKKGLFTSILLASSAIAFAQITDPTPYCKSDYEHNFNMVKQIKIGTKTFAIGAKGSWGTPWGYKYYSTEVFPDLNAGAKTNFTIDFYSMDDAEPRYFGVWIDFNQNNTFDATELVMQNSNTIKKNLPSFTDPDVSIPLDIMIPATAKPGKTRVRLVRGENEADLYGPYSAAFTLNPCFLFAAHDNSYGVVYDFNVNIVAGTPAAPKADFSVSATTGSPATVFNFTDKSTGAPTTYKWTFTPATVAYQSATTSASASPSVKFTASGTYTVKLFTSNATGKDSITKTNLIKIVPTGIQDVNGNNVALSVYPNPAKDFFMVDNAFIGSEMQIMDAQGKLVQARKLTNSKIDISNLASGLYFVKMINGADVYTQSISVSK